MLSRLTTQSFRGLSHTSKLVSRVQGGGLLKQTTFTVRRTVTTTPTAGKSSNLESLVGASVLTFGSIFLYGSDLGKTSARAEKESAWPQYVCDRLTSTYGYLAASVGVSAAVGVAARRSAVFQRIFLGGSFVPFLGLLGVAIASCSITRYIPYEDSQAKHAAWLIHTAAVGAAGSALYSSISAPVLLRAALCTAGTVAGLSTVALRAPSERFLAKFEQLSKEMNLMIPIPIFAVPFAGLASGARPNVAAMGLVSIMVLACLAFSSAKLLHDTQRLVMRAKQGPPEEQKGGFFTSSTTKPETKSFDPINAQMSIYMDIINIFTLVSVIGQINST